MIESLAAIWKIYVGSISWILMRGKVIAIKGAHPSQFIFWAGLLCSSTKCMCVYYTSSIAVAFKEEAASFQYSWPPSSSEATKCCCTTTTYTQQAPSFLLLRRISIESDREKVNILHWTGPVYLPYLLY